MSERTGIDAALLAVQRAGLTVTKGKRNPHFKAKYVDLGDLLEAVTPVLNENDLLLTQPVVALEGAALGVKSRLVHVPTGEFAESVMPLTELAKNDPQGQGSAITYGRRYTLMSLLGLVGEDDDDGNAASGSKPSTTKKRPTKTKPNDAASAPVEEY